MDNGKPFRVTRYHTETTGTIGPRSEPSQEGPGSTSAPWWKVRRWERRWMPFAGLLAAIFLIFGDSDSYRQSVIAAISCLGVILWAVSILYRDRVNSIRRESAED